VLEAISERMKNTGLTPPSERSKRRTFWFNCLGLRLMARTSGVHHLNKQAKRESGYPAGVPLGPFSVSVPCQPYNTLGMLHWLP
jgi:hypothetical protein